jgi:uncharacterized protein (DUF2141 family)
VLRRTLVYLCLAAAGLFGCATPVPPSGGPVDRSPPEIVRTEPLAGSVRVSGRTVRIEFADWMDQNSIERSLSITPEPDARPTIRWRRRTAEIVFPEDFLPNTTYVLTFDRNLRTFRGGTLNQPLSLAFSTGDQIDTGRLAGRVVEATLGEAVQGIDIYAYRGPGSDAPPLATLPDRPAYRTQTGDDGTFELQHVADGAYFVIALQDVNRNRRPDPGERFAAPPLPWVAADTAAVMPERPWILTAGDTLAPALNRVRSLSHRHLEFRFSEPVTLLERDPSSYGLSTIEGAPPPPIADVFVRAEDRRFVYVVLGGPLAEGRYRAQAGPVADTLGNVTATSVLDFDAVPSPDTLRQRFAGFIPDTTEFDGGMAELLAWQRPGFRLHMPVDSLTLAAGVSVADTTGAARPFSLFTVDGTSFRLDLDPPLNEGEIVDVSVTLEGLAEAQRFRRLSEQEVGEIAGRVDAGDVPLPIFVELFAADTQTLLTSLRVQDDGAFMFEGLPEGEYRLRAFSDPEGDGRWYGGNLTPYRPPAPIRWVRSVVSVRPRWETTLPEAISFSDPPQVPSPETIPVDDPPDFDEDP